MSHSRARSPLGSARPLRNPSAGSRPSWTAVPAPAMGADLVHRHLPQPRPKRSLPLALKARELTNHDHEDLLRQVVGLNAQSGNSAQPSADQRQVDALQPVPVGGVRPGRLEPIEQADGGWGHGRVGWFVTFRTSSGHDTWNARKMHHTRICFARRGHASSRNDAAAQHHSLKSQSSRPEFAVSSADPRRLVDTIQFSSRRIGCLSDESIVAHLTHELHEVRGLRQAFLDAGGWIIARDLFELIREGKKGNLHDRAWDEANRAVEEMRTRKNAQD